MGHLKSSCPKLGKSYTLSHLASNASDCCSQGVKVTGYRERGVVSHQLQPAVAPAPLVSPNRKQRSMKLVMLASIARAERSTTCVDGYLRRLPPRDFSCQKSDLCARDPAPLLTMMEAFSLNSPSSWIKWKLTPCSGKKWPCVTFLAW